MADWITSVQEWIAGLGAEDAGVAIAVIFAVILLVVKFRK